MSSSSSLNSLLSSSTPSTSATDISDILAAVAGATTPGIDVTSAVTAAIYAARAPERIWQADQTTLSSQMTDLQSIQAATSSLQADMLSLNSLAGPLSARDVSSSNSSAVTATAASGANLGNHEVSVTSLATTGSWYSSEQSSASAALSSSSFTITNGSGTSTTITTGSGGDATLNDVVTDINNQNLGVTASIVTDSNGARLSLVSNSSGSAADFSVSSGSSSGLTFTQAEAGTNASLSVDGVPITSASNTVTGAIPGVTLNLLSPTTTNTTNTPVDLSIQTDTSSISTTLNDFVNDYNSAVGLLNTQFSFNATNGTQGDLASDSSVRSLQETLESIASYTGTSTSGSSSVNSLNDLGISIGTDGTMSVDSTTLNNALTTDPSDVQNFLQGTSLNGFANSAYNQLDSFTDPSDGAFTVDLSSMKTQYSDLTDEINDFETNIITPEQASLTTDYTNAEEALQSLPTQMSQLQDELGNNSNNNNG